MWLQCEDEPQLKVPVVHVVYVGFANVIWLILVM